MANEPINFDLLFKLRLCVARFGEMDCAKWWNTQGILGSYGAAALSRGFPKTHRFTQAKVAFAAASHRCKEIYDPTNAYTLWALPPEIEDQFQEQWHDWLEEAEKWEPFFKSIEDVSGKELLGLLSQHGLVSPDQMENAKRLRRSAEGRSVQITGLNELNSEALVILAAGFSRGEPGKPTIPYARISDGN